LPLPLKQIAKKATAQSIRKQANKACWCVLIHVSNQKDIQQREGARLCMVVIFFVVCGCSLDARCIKWLWIMDLYKINYRFCWLELDNQCSCMFMLHTQQQNFKSHNTLRCNIVRLEFIFNFGSKRKYAN
jgi:hypothetical protein